LPDLPDFALLAFELLRAGADAFAFFVLEDFALFAAGAFFWPLAELAPLFATAGREMARKAAVTAAARALFSITLAGLFGR
jgi:hypothetical protein